MKPIVRILIEEISSIKNIEERKKIILNDVKSLKPRYKVLADEDPYRLFELLEGNENQIETYNWANEYKYEDYIEEYEIEFNDDDSKEWDLRKESIQRAHDLGFWYVTGICIIKSQDGKELPFEFQYSEGYLDGIIGTPYNQKEHGNHGILFY